MAGGGGVGAAAAGAGDAAGAAGAGNWFIGAQRSATEPDDWSGSFAICVGRGGGGAGKAAAGAAGAAVGVWGSTAGLIWPVTVGSAATGVTGGATGALSREASLTPAGIMTRGGST